MLFRGAAPCLLDDHLVQAAQLIEITDRPAPGVSGIEYVLLELRLQLRQLQHRRLEALLALGREPHAGKAEVAHGVRDQLTLYRAEDGTLLLGDGAIGAVERLALGEIG